MGRREDIFHSIILLLPKLVVGSQRSAVLRPFAIAPAIIVGTRPERIELL